MSFLRGLYKEKPFSYNLLCSFSEKYYTLSSASSRGINYTSYFNVFNPNPATTSTHLMFDGSARSHWNSSNKCLHLGPNFLHEVQDVILNVCLFPHTDVNKRYKLLLRLLEAHSKLSFSHRLQIYNTILKPSWTYGIELNKTFLLPLIANSSFQTSSGNFLVYHFLCLTQLFTKT